MDAEQLLVFLRARLDEDQAEVEKQPDREDDHLDGYEILHDTETGWPCYEYLRIAKKRALAEAATKRALLDAYAEVAEMDTEDAEPEFAYGRAVGLGVAVRHLAAAYADHPDYREEWRP